MNNLLAIAGRQPCFCMTGFGKSVITAKLALTNAANSSLIKSYVVSGVLRAHGALAPGPKSIRAPTQQKRSKDKGSTTAVVGSINKTEIYIFT